MLIHKWHITIAGVCLNINLIETRTHYYRVTYYFKITSAAACMWYKRWWQIWRVRKAADEINITDLLILRTLLVASNNKLTNSFADAATSGLGFEVPRFAWWITLLKNMKEHEKVDHPEDLEIVSFEKGEVDETETCSRWLKLYSVFLSYDISTFVHILYIEIIYMKISQTLLHTWENYFYSW
jgi:hypothetical protein